MAQGSLKVAGPFRGAAFVESVQTPQHDELSVNVQYAYGRKQPRDGFPYVVSNFGALNARLGLYDHGPGIPQYILYVGPKTNTFEIIVKVLDGSGVPVAVGGNPPGYEFNLTTLYGEPVAPAGRFHVTFVQTMLSSITATTRFVLLIVTEHTTYVFDPTAGTTIAPMSTAQVSAGGDAIRAYDGSMAYLDTAPYGRTACKWNNSVVYAGFDIGDTVTLTQPNPLAGTSTTLTDVVQDSTRQIQSLAPYLLMMSDPYDSAAIAAQSLWSVDSSDPVTHVRQYRQNLLILTQRSGYIMTGQTTQDFAVTRVFAGNGCIAPRSVVEVNGTVYWMGADGVYAWNGTADPQKISVGIDPLWTGRYVATMDSDYFAVHNDINWPWQVNGQWAEFSDAIYRPQEEQVWWTLPVSTSTAYGVPNFAVILVLNLKTGAWAFYTGQDGAVSMSHSITGGLINVINESGNMTLSTTYDGWVLRYGGRRLDRSASRLPYYWITPKLLPNNDEKIRWGAVRVQTLPEFDVRKYAPSTAPYIVLRPDNFWDSTETAITFYSQPDPDNANSRIWDYTTWGGTTWQKLDWFTSVNPLNGTTPGVRLGFVHVRYIAGLSEVGDIVESLEPIGIIRSFELEYESWGRGATSRVP